MNSIKKIMIFIYSNNSFKNLTKLYGYFGRSFKSINYRILKIIKHNELIYGSKCF